MFRGVGSISENLKSLTASSVNFPSCFTISFSSVSKFSRIHVFLLPSVEQTDFHTSFIVSVNVLSPLSLIPITNYLSSAILVLDLDPVLLEFLFSCFFFLGNDSKIRIIRFILLFLSLHNHMIKTIILRTYRTVRFNVRIYKIRETSYNIVNLSPHMFIA